VLRAPQFVNEDTINESLMLR